MPPVPRQRSIRESRSKFQRKNPIKTEIKLDGGEAIDLKVSELDRKLAH